VIVILHKFDAFQLVEYHFMIGRVPFPFRKCGRDIPCFQSDWGFKLTDGLLIQLHAAKVLTLLGIFVSKFTFQRAPYHEDHVPQRAQRRPAPQRE